MKDSHIGTFRTVYDPETGATVRVKVGALKNGMKVFTGYGRAPTGTGCGACPVWRDVPAGERCRGCPR
jgi:hypothetical protein